MILEIGEDCLGPLGQYILSDFKLLNQVQPGLIIIFTAIRTSFPKHLHLCDSLSVPELPQVPWGTSPVGSPRTKSGAPLRYGALGAIPALLDNHMFGDTTHSFRIS
jgi:hypothetical protein